MTAFYFRDHRSSLVTVKVITMMLQYHPDIVSHRRRIGGNLGGQEESSP